MSQKSYRADLIRSELARRHWSHDDLYEQSGVSRATISGIVNGKADPKVSTLAKISRALNLSLSDLFATDEQAHRPEPAQA